MGSVLVTGGAGYIGSHTCVELLECGREVIVIDNFVNSSYESIKRVQDITGKKMKFFEGDMRDRDFLRSVFSENEVDSVIHFAGLKAVGESCEVPLEYYDNNLNSLIALCETMAGFNVKKLVFSSSATVYGDNQPPYNENMKPGLITNPYGRTKYMAEQILSDLSISDGEWSILILRYFNPIGAHESGKIGEDPKGIPNNLMPYILKVAIGELPELKVFGGDYKTPDGTCIRDYIHVVDLAEGHISALKKLGKFRGFDIYNLGTGKGCSVLELINKFEKVCKINLNYSVGDRRDGDLPVCFADTSKAEKQLNWKAKYDIGRMCEDSWRWQISNPKGYKR